MDGARGSSARLEGHGSNQLSVDQDILHLSQQWEARRTIRNGDTPGQALRKGPRPALAAISANMAAAAAVNPFSFTAQRLKAAGGLACAQQQQQHCHQPSVRFALDEAPPSKQREQAGAAAAATAAAAAAGAENLPTAVGAATPRLGATLAADGVTASAGGSPSPYVLFRGRLSFAAEVDSARKFDRPTTARKSGAPGGAGLKRKLLISPGVDISAAFPTLQKPVAKQRRRSLSDLGPSWSVRAAQAEEEQQGTAAAAEDAAAGGGGAEASGQGVYWSDPLPLPLSAARQDGAAAAAAAAARRAAAAAEEDMIDTAASPASSGGGGACSPAGCGMDACSCSPAPAFSPLRALQHVLPTVDNPDCGFPCISVRTMRDLLLHGPAAFGLSDYVVVDCRYDYEHAGGRLPGAVHLTTPEELSEFLSAPRPCPDYWQRTALIFHCEFSTERGPRAAKYVRNKDREAHMHDYPALSQPHVFVLQGGYKAFWKSFSELCQGGYTPMDHPDFTQELKVCHNIVKRAWAKTTRTYGRSQRQRRPSYRLRQSGGVGRGGEQEGGAGEALADAADNAPAPPPAVVAAQHVQRS